jgi:type III restriction enzyme
LSGKKFETLTVRPKKKKEEQQTPGQMTLFDVFSGQNAGEQQSTEVAEPAVDSTPTSQPQVTGGQAQQTETTEQVQTQSSANTTAPAQSAPGTSQPSDTAIQSENNAVGSSADGFKWKLLKRKSCLIVKRL